MDVALDWFEVESVHLIPVRIPVRVLASIWAGQSKLEEVRSLGEEMANRNCIDSLDGYRIRVAPT